MDVDEEDGDDEDIDLKRGDEYDMDSELERTMGNAKKKSKKGGFAILIEAGKSAKKM